MQNTNWKAVLLYVFFGLDYGQAGDMDEDLRDDLKAGKFDRLSDAKGELTSDGFRITYDGGKRAVSIRLFMGTIFRCYSSPMVNVSSMILERKQGEARHLYDEIVDRLLAA